MSKEIPNKPNRITRITTTSNAPKLPRSLLLGMVATVPAISCGRHYMNVFYIEVFYIKVFDMQVVVT
jgi:hypothetical protein